MVRLAIDSFPLGRDILSSTDYSGLQLFGLGALAIQECLQNVICSEDDKVFTAYLADDERDRVAGVTLSAMFAHGLKLLLERAPMLRATAFRNLLSIGTRPDSVQVRLSAPIKGFAEVFKLPNWVAAAEGKPYPERSLKQVADEQWVILGPTGVRHFRVCVVGSPEENIELARSGQLDFTADTCVDFAQVDKTYTRADTGLHAHLVPLCEEAKFREVIHDLRGFRLHLDELQIHEALYCDSVWQPKNCLEISYDDFHPNRQICARIAQHLNRKGWSVKLLLDDYYRPVRPGDCKLIIKRPLVNAPLFRAYSILGFARTKEHAKKLAASVHRAEAGEAIDWAKLLEENAVSRPIAPIPCIFQSRTPNTPNPLIRNFLPAAAGTHT